MNKKRFQYALFSPPGRWTGNETGVSVLSALPELLYDQNKLYTNQ